MMKLKKLFNREETGCDSRRALLSRYLDNDLRGEAAARLASHLHGCVSCRAEFEAMRAQRAALSAAANPRGGAAARVRVMQRFEQSVRASSGGAAASRQGVLRRGLALRVGLGAACAALVSGGALLLRTLPSSSISPPTTQEAAATTATATPVAAEGAVVRLLPATDDLNALFALHDARVKAAFPVPAASPKSPVAHAATPTRSRRRRHFAPSPAEEYAAAPSHTGSEIARESGADLGSEPDALAPEDLPEAL